MSSFLFTKSLSENEISVNKKGFENFRSLFCFNIPKVPVRNPEQTF